jgi:hypothetical protein
MVPYLKIWNFFWMDHYQRVRLGILELFNSLNVAIWLIFHLDLLFYLTCAFTDSFGDLSSSWSRGASCANYLGAQMTICKPRLAALALCFCDPTHTSRIHLFVCSRHDGALTYLKAHYDSAVLKFSCLVFYVLIIHLYHVVFSLTKYSFNQLASFSNGFRLSPTKPSFFGNALLVHQFPSIQTSMKTKQPIRIVWRQNSFSPLPANPWVSC